MPAIRIKVDCTEFGRNFTAASIIDGLDGPYARAMVEAGLAQYHGWYGPPVPSRPWPGTPDAPLPELFVGQLWPAPATGVVPITSVQWADPTAFGIFDGDPRAWEYNGATFRRTAGAWVTA